MSSFANGVPTRQVELPQPGGSKPVEASTLDEEWKQKNARRLQLVKKKNRQGLTPEEQTEFQKLQEDFFTYLETRFPGPPLDLDRLDRIEARLRASSENRDPQLPESEP